MRVLGVSLIHFEIYIPFFTFLVHKSFTWQIQNAIQNNSVDVSTYLLLPSGLAHCYSLTPLK